MQLIKRLTVGFMLVAGLIGSGCNKGFEEVELTSPDGNASIRFFIQDESALGQHVPVYSVQFNGHPIVAPSSIGLELQNEIYLDRNFRISGVNYSEIDETYSPIVGENRTIRNYCKQACIKLQTMSSPVYYLKIYLRAYNDGVAFRYELPEQAEIGDFVIAREKTTFRMAENFQGWVLPLNEYTSNYERNYQCLPMSEIPDNTIIGLPLTLEGKDQTTVAITEANLTDYAGLYLCPGSNDLLLLKSCLSPLPENKKIRVTGKTPHKSPWRVIMLGDNPGKLVESEIIMNLNESCAIENPEWIKAGLVGWDWWAKRIVKNVDFEGGMNTATMKHYIDFAAEMGWEYMLIDAAWYGDHRDANADIATAIPAVDLPGIIEYARQKHVDILLWLNWKNVDNQMETAFPLYEQWGVKGVKIDYMNLDDQEMVQFYHRVVKKAAKHHLTVDFHGAYKPTGIRRTWPNLITREGVMGLEHSRWSKNVTPEHDLIIPFTRMLAGPMDYTPGAFRNAYKADFEVTDEPGSQGTRCHQLAMYVVYDSPLQMCVDYPSAYRNQPGIEFLRYVPATWDESKVLNGQIGKFITIARRSGNEWYVGSMCASQAQTLEIKLDFLNDHNYEATIFSDKIGGLATDVRIETKPVRSADRLTLNLGRGGGCAIRLVPVQ